MILAQQRVVNTSVKKIYRAPKGKTAIIRLIELCNTSGAKIKVCLFVYRNGKMCTPKEAVYYEKDIAKNDSLTKSYLENEFRISGDETISVRCDTPNALSITVLGDQ